MSVEDARALTHVIVEFYEKLSSWEHSIVRGKGLTLSQMHTMEILGIHKALRMKELAERMGVTTGTLTVIVDKLAAKRLVQRRPNEQDRRSILVELTEEGRQHFHEHDRHHLQLTMDLVDGLTRQEVDQLATILAKMNQAF
jgi:DNA-binding MarR family transcriptional regulator